MSEASLNDFCFADLFILFVKPPEILLSLGTAFLFWLRVDLAVVPWEWRATLFRLLLFVVGVLQRRGERQGVGASLMATVGSVDAAAVAVASGEVLLVLIECRGDRRGENEDGS